MYFEIKIKLILLQFRNKTRFDIIMSVSINQFLIYLLKHEKVHLHPFLISGGLVVKQEKQFVGIFAESLSAVENE